MKELELKFEGTFFEAKSFARNLHPFLKDDVQIEICTKTIYSLSGCASESHVIRLEKRGLENEY